MLRRAVAAFWFALLLLGQQGAAWHAVAHSAERLGRTDQSAPAQAPCDQCFLGAQLASALGTTVAQTPVLLAASARLPAAPDTQAPAQPPVYFLSRAPPRHS
jgi:hypothetical protein